jgi:PAS domain S-box-containing protein
MVAGERLDSHDRFLGFFPERAADFLRLLGAWSIPFALLDENDRVLLWNRGAAKFYGVSEDEAQGKPFGDVVAEGGVQLQTPVSGVRTRRYEARHRSASGVELPVMVTRTDLPAGDGQEGAFVLITDLT